MGIDNMNGEEYAKAVFGSLRRIKADREEQPHLALLLDILNEDYDEEGDEEDD